MRLAAFLVLLIGLTHYGAQPIAEWYGWRSSAVFYVLRGLEGTALFALVVARSRVGALAAMACAWGFVEEAQTSICRLSQDMAAAPAVAPYTGLCGPWAYGLGVVIMAALAALVAREARNG